MCAPSMVSRRSSRTPASTSTNSNRAARCLQCTERKAIVDLVRRERQASRFCDAQHRGERTLVRGPHEDTIPRAHNILRADGEDDLFGYTDSMFPDLRWRARRHGASARSEPELPGIHDAPRVTRAFETPEEAHSSWAMLTRHPGALQLPDSVMV